jgi:HEAT repeat protein
MKRVLWVCLGLLLTGCGNDRPTEELVGQLKDPDAARRLEAVRELGSRGAAEGVVPALAAALKDRDGYVRRDAARALGKAGAGARGAVPALLAARKDRERSVRKAAEDALKQIDPGAAAKAGGR